LGFRQQEDEERHCEDKRKHQDIEQNFIDKWEGIIMSSLLGIRPPNQIDGYQSKRRHRDCEEDNNIF